MSRRPEHSEDSPQELSTIWARFVRAIIHFLTKDPREPERSRRHAEVLEPIKAKLGKNHEQRLTELLNNTGSLLSEVLSSNGYTQDQMPEWSSFLLRGVSVTNQVVQDWLNRPQEVTEPLDRENEIRASVIKTLSEQYPFVEIPQVQEVLFDFLIRYTR